MASTSHVVHALSLPGKRIFRRHATINTDTEVVDHDQVVRLSKSPAFRSPLFPSPTHGRRDRSIRQHSIIKRRKKLFRRKGDFQLNYKDYDDELLNIIESEHKLPTRPRIFRAPLKRKSLSKTLVPTEDLQERGIAEEATLVDQLDIMQEDTTVSLNDVEVEEDVFEETYLTTTSRPTGLASKIKRKKKPQVVVSNIEELHEAILDRGLELRDVELNYTPPPSLLSSKKPLSLEMAETDDESNDAVQELVLMTNELNPNYPDIELENKHEPNADEWQLIGNVIAEDFPLVEEPPKEEATKLFSHEVLNLLHQRYHSQSTPMSRSSNDTSILALSIEGGGMRGAVSGGMAAAIACLGLSNSFDSIYGSSAGSIIGSYFVSRQLYLDVYTDVIPAGKDLFVSKTKIIGDIFRNMFYIMKDRPLGKKVNANLIERFRNPAGTNDTLVETLPPTRAGGLNTSFVLDSIMCPENGLRPLDLEAFAHNDAIQPLRIVSSSVELDTGKLKSICFGSNEGHFRDQFTSLDKDDSSSDSEYLYPEVESAALGENGLRRGFWASLGASMSVPGAAGSPIHCHLPHSETNEPTPHACFDAFCYEPVVSRELSLLLVHLE